MKQQRNIRKKSNENLQKRRFPAYIRYFLPEKFFSKIGHFNTHLCAKNQEKLMMKSRENAKKPVFPAFLVGKIFFPENRAPSHFGYCHFASLCHKSEKTNEPILRKAGNRRTDERTDNG